MDRSFDTMELGHTGMYPYKLSLKELFTTQYARSKIFLNFTIVKLFSGFIKNNNILHRIPSFVFYLGLVIFTYYSVTRLLNREIAFISISLMAVSPRIMYRSVDYQDYMILIWFSFVSIYLMWVILSRKTGWAILLLFIVILSLNFINSIKAVFVFPVIIIFPLSMLILRSCQTEYFCLNKMTLLVKIFSCLICSVIIVCTFFYLQNVNIVELLIQKITTGKVSMDFLNYNNPYGEILPKPVPDGFKPVSVLNVFKLMSPTSKLLLYLYIVFSIAGLAYLYKKEKALFLLFAVSIFSTILVGQLVFYVYDYPKYYESIICFYLILAATGFYLLLGGFQFIGLRYFTSKKSLALKIISVITITLLLQPIILIDRNHALSAMNKIDYTPIVNYFRNNLKDNDIILNASLLTTSQFPELWHDHPLRIFGNKITLNHGIELLPGRKGPIPLYYVTKSNILNISEIKSGLKYMDYFPIGYTPQVIFNAGGLKLWKVIIMFDNSKNIGLEHFETFFWNVVFANYYLTKSEPHETLHYYNKALKYEKYLDRIYNNIGIAYLDLQNTQKSLEYFYKAVDACKNYKPGEIAVVPTVAFEPPHFNIANQLIGFGDITQQQKGLAYLKSVAQTKPYIEKYYEYFKERIQNSKIVNGRWNINAEPFQAMDFLTDLCKG